MACVNTVNETSGSIKCWEILESQRDWQFPKKDSVGQSVGRSVDWLVGGLYKCMITYAQF
jgi:hypothetical protein